LPVSVTQLAVDSLRNDQNASKLYSLSQSLRFDRSKTKPVQFAWVHCCLSGAESSALSVFVVVCSKNSKKMDKLYSSHLLFVCPPARMIFFAFRRVS